VHHVYIFVSSEGACYILITKLVDLFINIQHTNLSRLGRIRLPSLAILATFDPRETGRPSSVGVEKSLLLQKSWWSIGVGTIRMFCITFIFNAFYNSALHNTRDPPPISCAFEAPHILDRQVGVSFVNTRG